MPIHVDVIVNAHKRSITNATRSIKSEFDKAAADIGKDVGREIGDRIAQGIRSSSAEVNKAMDDATNAAITRRRTKEYFKEIKKAFKKGEVDAEAYRRALEDLGKATRNYDLLVTKLRQTEDDYQKAFRERSAVTREARAALQDFTASHDEHLDALNRLRAANLDVISQNNLVAKAFDTAGDSLGKARQEYEKYQRMEREGKATRDQLLKQWQQVESAWKKEGRAIRDTTAALAKHTAAQTEHHRRQEEHLRRQRENANRSDFGEAGQWAARNLGALTPLGVVTPTLVLPLGVAFTQVANAAVAASQSISLLPAALVAGSAAMGTMHMATAGFSDTISAMASGDLEKFAESIQNLAPNAQQAALQIQNLWPALKGMQQAVQNTFFADTSEMIYRLAGVYGPTIQKLTTGIAGSLNEVMTTIFDDLMKPGTQDAVTEIATNIGQAFRGLAPVMKPLADSFLELTRVGSGFLPGMMGDLASLTKTFSDFINESSKNGDLDNFMKVGWESIKAVGEAILDIGNKIYEVFGLRSMQDIDNFKKNMHELTEVIGTVLGVIKIFFEDIAGAFRTFQNMFGPLLGSIGGLDNAIAKLVEITIGVKLVGMLSKLAGAEGFGGFGSAASKAAGEVDKVAAAAGSVEASTTRAATGVGKVTNSLTSLVNGGSIARLAGQVAGLTVAFNGLTSINGNSNDGLGALAAIAGGALTGGAVAGPWGALAGAGVGGVGAIIATIVQDQARQRAIEEANRASAVPGTDVTSNGLLEALTGQSLPPGAYGAPPPPGGAIPSNILMPGGIPAGAGQGPPNPNSFPNPNDPFGLFDVPPPPPDKDAKEPPWQSTPGTFELSNIPLGTFPGAEWSVPSVNSLYNPPGYDDFKAGKPGSWVTDPMAQQQAAWAVEEKANAVEEARKRALEMRADNNKSEDDKLKAEHDVIERERDLIQAQVKQAEEARGHFEKATEQTKDLTKGMDDMSAMLDKDLGLSRGLPGLADNLVRFIGALAAAPLLGPLNAMTEALGGKDATGVGLSGILAAQGVFGPKFQIAGYDENGKPYSMQAAMDAGLGTDAPISAPTGVQNLNTGLTTLGPNAPMPSILEDTGSVSSGPQSRNAAALIQQLFGSQIRGKIGGSRDNNTAPGTHDAGLSIDIPIGPDQMALGDEINAWLQANKDQLGLKYSIWRDKGVQADGGTFNQPGHQNHIDAHFNGQPGSPAAVSGAPGSISGMSSYMSPAGFPIPLPVTIVGGTLGDMGAFSGPGTQHGKGGLPGPSNTGGASGTMDSNARNIIVEGMKRGLPPNVIKAALAIALQETQLGTHPNTNGIQNQNGTPSIQGMFQQDGSYHYDKTNPALAAGGFFDRFIQNGGMKPGVDPWDFAVTGVQKPNTPNGPGSPGYDRGSQSGEWLQQEWGAQVEDFYNRMLPPPGSAALLPTGTLPYGPPGGTPPGPGPGAPPIGNPMASLLGPGASPPSLFPGLPVNPAQQNDGGGGPGTTGPSLQPGITPVINNTGKPETIVNPQGMVGDRHVSELFPAPGPGPGNGAPGNPFATFNPSNALAAGSNPEGQQYGGAEPDAAPGGGASMSGGGLWQAAVGAASMAADAFAPGSGAAVQIGAQVAQRAIKLGGQLAGVGVQGLMETFLPTGASDLANNNWLTRIGGAFTGMGPQLPNLAGKPPTPVPAQQPQDLSMFPQSVPTGPQQPSQPPVINYNLYGVGDVKDTSMNDFINNTARQASAGSVLPQGTSGMR